MAVKLNIKETIIIGTRGLFVDNNDNILGVIPNSFSYEDIIKEVGDKNYKYINLGSSSRFALSNNKIFGFYGLRKFYHLIDDNKGVLVFYSIYKDHPTSKKFTEDRFNSYVKAAKYLLNLNIFPEIIDTCEIMLDCKVKLSKNKKLILKNKADGIITKRLDVPQYYLDIDNDIHRKVLKRV